MSYFDHISCHACKGNIDPDRIKPVEGRLICPYCNTELKLMDLFGLKASFAEDDQPNLTLDELVPGEGGHLANPWGQPEGGHTLNQGRWEPDIGDAGGIHTGSGETQGGGRAPSGREQFRGSNIPKGAQVARHIEPPPGEGRGGASGGGYGDAPRTPKSHQISDHGGQAPPKAAARRPSPPARRPTALEPDQGGGTSALDALRRLKGKK